MLFFISKSTLVPRNIHIVKCVVLKILQIIFILLVSKIALTASMQGSKHDLSTTNFYGSMGGASTEICVFCHTPHSGNSDNITGPLWNRSFTDTSVFVLYGGVSGMPNNPTLVCLSCHDGVSGLGQTSAVTGWVDTHSVINGAGRGTSSISPNCNACHFSGDMYPGPEWTIGPDLTDDHPVSISYENARLASPDFFELTPKNGLKLYNGNVECSSCHDPHETVNTAFLRLSNSASALCTSCHIK